MSELKLIPPTDPRVLTAIAPFKDDMLKEENFKDRKELSDKMFEAMFKYGGIGLSANQVGLPFNMFVMGGHPQLENGMKLACFNPMIISASDETVMMKEGCLTFPFIFLNIKRPRKVVVKYEDENGDLQEGHLDGMMSRIFQHEYDHMLGRTFTEHASKFKYDLAKKKAEKEIEKFKKLQQK
jgi:peptide deformylase